LKIVAKSDYFDQNDMFVVERSFIGEFRNKDGLVNKLKFGEILPLDQDSAPHPLRNGWTE
jgi:hypothetical protein